MTISEHLQQQDEQRRPYLEAIHNTILKNDPTVKATVGSMMGKEMILYNCPGSFKYGLASVKEHMSLHALPIYAEPSLHAKYLALLPNAKLQKGCVNFKNDAEFPLKVVGQLIADCARVDLVAIRENQKKKKK